MPRTVNQCGCVPSQIKGFSHKEDTRQLSKLYEKSVTRLEHPVTTPPLCNAIILS